ncbi:tetratricopeptide repeat protein [Candidatus Poribacteria bacterium]|nr:tetratricopeptide repeat protein [Candidatus Poribacteria bacterium]
MKLYLSAMLIVLIISGCAYNTPYHQGRRALNMAEYDQAITLLNQALEESPDDARILTDLGTAYYKKEDFDKAVPYLEKAKSVDPMYGMSYFYLGLIYERQQEYQKALEEYNEYYQKAPLSPLGRRLRGYMGTVMRRQIKKEIAESVRKEGEIDVDSIPGNTLAVSYFTNLTNNEEYDVLQKGLAEMIITDLSQVKSLKVLERKRMQILMEELGLEASGLAEPGNMPRMGRLLGARRIVNGGFALPSEDQLRIDAVSTDIATNESDAQADAMGELESFFQMEKDLVFNILDDMNIPLTQEERDAIQQVPTESFLAFLAYSRGLDYEDRGMYREAAGEFQKATQLDPGFSHASEKAQDAQILAEIPSTGSSQDIEALEQVVVSEEMSMDEQGEVEEMALAPSDMLDSIMSDVAPEYEPDITDSAPPPASKTPPQEIQNAVIQITVELP